MSFDEGSSVTLTGLSMAEMNGKAATVTGPMNARGRIPICLKESGKRFVVKQINLCKVLAYTGVHRSTREQAFSDIRMLAFACRSTLCRQVRNGN